MGDMGLRQPELIGREDELAKLRSALDNAYEGAGSTIFIGGEAGIGKTRLVSELIEIAKSRVTKIIRGWCLAESLQPLMPFRSGLREAGLYHLISDNPPPFVVSAYIMNDAGMLIAKAEREETELDPDIFTSMLQAVGNFVKDSLSLMGRGQAGRLNQIGFGNYTIILQSLGKLSFATVIEGDSSEFMIDDMKRTLAEIGNRFDNWTGSVSETAVVEPKVAWYIDSGKYDGKFLVDDPKIKQENLFDNVLLGIQRLAEEKPLILFIDDIQWADPTSLNLVHYLARNTRQNKVLLIGTYRPEDVIQSYDDKTHQLTTVMQNMNRELLFQKIELERLGPEDTGKIIESALGKSSFDDSFSDRIYNETGGTPFFILEVAKLLIEEGCITRDEDGNWTLVASMDDLDIPSKVYDVVKRRLDRLMDEQREILECASVIGEEFTTEVLQKTIEIRKIQLLKNLSEIEKTHYLIHYLQDKYRFDHTKVQEVLYNGIGEELRQEYHRIIGETIIDLHREDLDEVVDRLAYHFHEARDVKAADFLVKAGDKAKERYENAEAVRFYRNALALADDDRKVCLLENLGDIQGLVGEWDDAILSFDEAMELGDGVTKAGILRKSGEIHYKKGEYDKALGKFETALSTIADPEKELEAGRIHGSISELYIRLGEFKKAHYSSLKNLSIAEKIGEEKEIGEAYNRMGVINWFLGEWDDSISYFQKGLDFRREKGDVLSISSSLNNLGNLYYSKGQWDRAIVLYNESMELRDKIGDVQGLSASYNNLGNVYGDKGEFEQAILYHEKSLDIKERIGDPVGAAWSYSNLGDIWYRKKDALNALENYRKALKLRENAGDAQGLTASLLDMALAQIMMGQTAEAENLCDRVEELIKNSEDKMRKAMFMRCRGTLLSMKDDWEEMERHFRESINILLEVDSPLDLAHTKYDFGLALKKKGDMSQAIEQLKESLKIYTELGATHDKEMVQKTLEEIG